MANHLSESLPERTFQYQSSLPALPVPTLEMSLSKYLDSGKIVAWYNLLSYSVAGFLDIYQANFKYVSKYTIND